jgi:acetoin utilization protein AcuC
MRSCVFVHSSDLDTYSYPADCPFSSQRAGRARKIALGLDLLSGPNIREVPPPKADRGEVIKFHTDRYLHALERAQGGEFLPEWLGFGLGTPETPLFRGMYDYAMLACGGSLLGARLILSGSADVVFNPSGGYHHAHAELAEGFCYINDVALACQTLAEAGTRVLYLDVDAHHGDGVQQFFYGRRDVLTLSVHESGRTLFPFTGFEQEFGEGEGLGYCINIPLPEGTYDEAYLKVFYTVVMPVLRQFDPDVIVLELGMDALAKDPLAHLSLTNNTFAEITGQLLATNKPILATGGGGYHIEHTARGWALCWSILCGADDNSHLLTAGLGGVMLQSSDWRGGLRDRAYFISEEDRKTVDTEVDRVIATLKTQLAPFFTIAT